MKWFIRIIIPMLVLGGCIYGDIRFAGWLFNHLPDLGVWLFWAKVGIIFGIVWLTAGLTLVFTFLSCAIATVLTE
jgi:hypothetical protein